MITGYYGKNGAMTTGWETKAEAYAELNEFYTDYEYIDCYVTEIRPGEWVIAY